MPYPPAFPLLQHTLGDLSLTQPLDEFKDCPLYLGGDVGGGEVHMIHPYNLPRSVEVVKVRAGLGGGKEELNACMDRRRLGGCALKLPPTDTTRAGLALTACMQALVFWHVGVPHQAVYKACFMTWHALSSFCTNGTPWASMRAKTTIHPYTHTLLLQLEHPVSRLSAGCIPGWNRSRCKNGGQKGGRY
eukprot:scaffold186716_cov19-Tisochrysis_lutea.AAC.1